MSKRQIETLQDKIKVYEQVLHDIQCYTEIMPDPLTINKLHAIICAWSKAHRDGITNSAIQKQFLKLKQGEYLNE